MTGFAFDATQLAAAAQADPSVDTAQAPVASVGDSDLHEQLEQLKQRCQAQDQALDWLELLKLEHSDQVDSTPLPTPWDGAKDEREKQLLKMVARMQLQKTFATREAYREHISEYLDPKRAENRAVVAVTGKLCLAHAILFTLLAGAWSFGHGEPLAGPLSELSGAGFALYAGMMVFLFAAFSSLVVWCVLDDTNIDLPDEFLAHGKTSTNLYHHLSQPVEYHVVASTDDKGVVWADVQRTAPLLVNHCEDQRWERGTQSFGKIALGGDLPADQIAANFWQINQAVAQWRDHAAQSRDQALTIHQVEVQSQLDLLAKQRAAEQAQRDLRVTNSAVAAKLNQLVQQSDSEV